ncbi:MAG TPA: hydroxymethylbilane synthase [Jiangellaceae bacterium]|jgi:hydroxymethylbilane synthase|nr:hydroxymethylbilane synthase [Jiangellaceae bacterium]
MNRGAVRLGTRRSALALAQARSVAAALTAETGVEVVLVEITTQGDVSSAPLAQIGGTGVFVSALRDALHAGRIDCAVHSLKDLPTTSAPELTVAAIPPREDPRDVLCARDGLTLGELPPGARIGTGAPRRIAQLLALGLGLDVLPIRGNVDTRLARVADGSLDGVVLARAGLARLGRLEDATEVLDPLQMLPAPGQGALAVECRAGDEVAELLTVLDDSTTRSSVTAERSLLAALEAGCTAPVGAYAEAAEGNDGLELYLRAVVVSPDGALSIRKSATGPLTAAERLGRDLAAELLDDGAGRLVGVQTRTLEEEIVS